VENTSHAKSKEKTVTKSKPKEVSEKKKTASKTTTKESKEVTDALSTVAALEKDGLLTPMQKEALVKLIKNKNGEVLLLISSSRDWPNLLAEDLTDYLEKEN